jgi:hypothetical protein
VPGARHRGGRSPTNVKVEIADDQRLHLPKAASQVVARAVEKDHAVYFKIARAFEGGHWDMVERYAERDKTEFEKVSR